MKLSLSKSLCSLLIAASALLASCSSPESEGKSMAQKKIDATEKYINNMMQTFVDFTDQFNPSSYSTRAEARQQLAQKSDQLLNDYIDEARQIEQEVYDRLAKYEDQKQMQDFTVAYRYALDKYEPDTTMLHNKREAAYRAILTIIPVDPTEQKIAEDLVGRSFRGITGDYFGTDWSWRIDPNEIKDIKIESANKVNSTNIEYIVDIILQNGPGGQYNVKLKIYYTLEDRDDWGIELIQPLSISMVRTGRYETFIEPELGRYGDFNIRNNSDAALRVGGQILRNGEWEKFITIISPSSRSYIGCCTDYRIDFVELP